MARTYAEKTIKLLFGAARRCAFPGCDVALVFEDRGLLTVVAEIAHIRSEKARGPRYDSTYPSKLINSPENLLLLCGPHHKPVDDHASAYPVDELLSWKARQVEDGIRRDVSEQDVLRIVKHYELNQLGHEGFEKVCQALAARMFGPDEDPKRRRPRSRPYDAAFDGRAAEYPSVEAPWDGFIIVEAFFRYDSLNGAGRTADLTHRITRRFEFWFDADARHKRPDYVVFATNNSLAVTRDRGRSVASLLDHYARKYDLKAVELWDEGRITQLLDLYPEVHEAVHAMTASHVLLGNLLEPRTSSS
ncbi:HNH endonuclease [Lentzea sp. HUAS12]|uniref:HNH endonuclease n=1 Tax=Lentzea sp. HUAS12 TaxID=2951806 RepID=UPI00209D74B9|nr:HNH endonuclease [Lentzea sp. HUAS12]USX55629.1 HNH endonuclease [Lentzea sp. HUAS12]